MGSVFTCKLNPCCGNRYNCAHLDFDEAESIRAWIKKKEQMSRDMRARMAALDNDKEQRNG